MSRWYIDTSAALKLIQKEAGSLALVRQIGEAKPKLVGCRLLETAMRRAVHRNPALSQEKVSTFLETVDLYDLPSHVFTEAGLLPAASLRPLDAIHLTAAVSIGAGTVLTYDTRMAESARLLGLSVLAPS